MNSLSYICFIMNLFYFEIYYTFQITISLQKRNFQHLLFQCFYLFSNFIQNKTTKASFSYHQSLYFARISSLKNDSNQKLNNAIR